MEIIRSADPINQSIDELLSMAARLKLQFQTGQYENESEIDRLDRAQIEFVARAAEVFVGVWR